ncbi:MAG: cation diffusion facilitator family transporter [Clostridia bacterium]|nr:cation diffusion facilitator family transporter [Clostridia bacterium]
MTDSEKKSIALKVLVVTITVNVILTAFKLVAGLIGHSNAMESDAIHSLSDVATSIVVIIGIVISTRPRDNLHQYGHERFECAASIILAMMLFLTGMWESYTGLHELITGHYKVAELPSSLALIAAIVSIAVKEAMFWYTYSAAKKIDSLSLKADAWHHRSDAITSVAALVGIGAAMLFKLPIIDDIIAIVICLFIFKVAISIFVEALNKMVDRSCPEEVVEGIKRAILSVDGVLSVDELKTRVFGSKVYVDVEIGAYKNLTLEEAHKIAENTHHAVENYDDKIKHCMVHVNPVDIDTTANQTSEIIKDETAK